MIQRLKNAIRKLLINFKIRKIEILKKRTCQNMVVMETSSHVDSDISYQIVAR